MLGVTSVSFFNYLLGTCSYVFKSSLYTLIGCTVYSVSASKAKKDGFENLVFAGELMLTVLLTLFISIYAKSILDEKIKEK